MPSGKQHSRRRLLVKLVVVTALVLLAPGLPQASAADPMSVTLALSVPASVRVGTGFTLAVDLQASGAGVAGQDVRLEVGQAGAWTPVSTVLTDGAGHATLSLTAAGAGATYRAVFDGSVDLGAAQSNEATVAFVVVASTLSLAGSSPYVVDERSGLLRVRWAGSDGDPVTGLARLWLHGPGEPWRSVRDVRTGTDGRATIMIAPRVDTWYQVRGPAGPGWTSAVSATWYVDNRPPGVPVVLPVDAPSPQPSPAQRRAIGGGANVVATRIPDAVWSSMVGRSWHAGCPVGRSGLRYLRTNYWGFDGYRHRGELVVAVGAVAEFTRALRGLHAARVPIRSMYLPDRFGYNARSGGADDFASMAHDNTSAFNCRWVTGLPGVRSPHSYGRALDLDTWENPFHSAQGWLPNRWWIGHSNPRYAWRSSSHRVVRILRASGFRWTYPRSDPQHFDA